MNRVRLLPEQVANQIAAGEVIERPASVVKELVENSLDAGATRIVVEVAAAGRASIRVQDNGCGMSRDDALLCLERHATSKVATAADLARIATLGFRGEAIPSIASVSRFVLTTRPQEAGPHEPGCQILIHGGKILEVRDAPPTPGTCVEVRNLFFNLPARRKFLRSDATERAHIQHWMTTAALAHPHVAFHLTLEGRSAWQLPALPVSETTASRLDSLRQRLRLLLGDGLALLPVDASGALPAAAVAPEDPNAPADRVAPGSLRVWGWIGAPGVSRATRDDQHLFVNRRPVENRGLNAALLEGYHNALMKGRFPLVCLFLELDPAEVDVNIHPAKREVKFHRERAIRQFLAEAVREALQAWHLQRGVDPSTASPPFEARRPDFRPTSPFPSRPGTFPATSQGSVAAPLRPTPPRVPGASSPPPTVPAADAASAGGMAVGTETEAGAGTGAPGGAMSPAAGTQGVLPGHDVGPASHLGAGGAAGGPEAGRSEAVSSPGPMPLLRVPLRIVGVVGRLYVVLESDRGLVLLDQHAAHERVLYEQMLRRVQQGAAAPSQRLLLPETIEVSPRDAAFLRENLADLTRLGVGLSEFGERTFLLDALPPFVKSTAPRRFALELVDELRAVGSAVNAWRLGEAVVAKTVCRHAVKANDPLSGPELEALLENLRACDMPYTCPHGRPTLIEMHFREIEKKFGRVQG